MASRRERIEAALAGKVADRPPVAFWRHWAGDDQAAESHAVVSLAFQRTYDWDFIKVTTEGAVFHLVDWGVQTRINTSNLLGGREVAVNPFPKPADWARIKPIDVTQGMHGEHLRCLRRIRQEVGDDVPFLFTIFQPSTIAERIVGLGDLAFQARRYPKEVTRLMEVFTETMLAYLREGMKTGAAGLFYAVGTAGYSMWSEAEYREFALPYDLAILKEAAALGWFNLVHLCRLYPMFDVALQYPVQVFNWDDQVTPPSLAEARARTNATLVGGLDRNAHLLHGTPQEVQEKALDAFRQAGRKGFMLGAGCTVTNVTPWRNLQAARQAVERMTA
jgi:uroporphyrinogen decarboxylase